MATQIKKKTTTIAKKAGNKKPAIAPVSASKKVALKKVVPAKKVNALKAVKKANLKSVSKKSFVKPAAKTLTTKKLSNKKSQASGKSDNNKPIKKPASKLIPKGKTIKPIIKHSPVKKAAKTGVIKAVPNKLATPKKNTVKKSAAAVHKAPAKKKNATAIKTLKAVKSAKHTAINKVPSEPKTITDHKAEMKKALSKVKAKAQNTKKAERPFVMPKTNTEKARKYEPAFTKSVLDQAPEEYNGPTMRYSDNELIEFRELISRKLDTAKKELGYLQGLITRKDQMGGDDNDNRYMTMEDGGLSMEREQLSQMASRQISFIDHLEKAMMRIENKTYGICRVTGKLIDKARLRAVPHATLSIEAKMGIAK